MSDAMTDTRGQQPARADLNFSILLGEQCEREFLNSMIDHAAFREMKLGELRALIDSLSAIVRKAAIEQANR